MSSRRSCSERGKYRYEAFLTKQQRQDRRRAHIRQQRRDAIARESRHLPNLVLAYRDGVEVACRGTGRKIILVRKNPETAEALAQAHKNLLEKAMLLQR